MNNIVLCGSMGIKNKMLDIASNLKENGYNVLLPIECIEGKPKEIASRAHFNRIIDKKNKIILIINETKNGIKNYIGPNTFAEIAFGFHFEKQIYLLNDIYEPYKDELINWKVKCLNGDITKLKK